MAINKNSKAYQSLLKQGYTDEQIQQMSGAVASGQSAKDVVASTTPGATTTSKTTTSSSKTTTTSSTPKATTQTTTQTTTPKTTTQATNTNVGNWSYGSDTEQRQQEIRTNLDNAYAKNPTQFSSWDTFANAFNYNYSGRSDKERETMKNWYESKFGTTQNQTPATTKTQTDAVYDKNGNLHISYSDGSTQIIPGNTQTQQGVVGGQTGLSADGKTYTFLPGYEPIYPEGETAGDKSTSIANQGKLQQKSKTLSYQEDTQERYNQILDNLEKIYLTNPEYYTDRTTFDANFQIDQRSIGQQQLMVQWFYDKKKKERDYNAISGLTDGQSIYDAINNGNLTYDQLDLLKGTPQYNDYLSITQDKVNLATINNDPSMFFINSMPATLEDLRDEIMATIGDMGEYNMWEYMLSLYDGEDYDRVRQRVEDSTQEALLVKAEYDSIDANVRNRLEGTGATKAYINAVIAREQNDLIPRVNTAYAQLQADQTNYQLRHQSVEDKYKSYYDQAHYEIQKYNAQINAFQTMWGVYKDVAQYDWNYKQQVRLTELQESYNNPMLDSDDPDEAKRALKQALQGYYDTYGQIIKRDINQVMQDVYAYAKKNNVSLATALQKNFVDQLKAKPEYKELTNQYMYGREKAGTASSGSSSSTSSKSSTAKDGETTGKTGGATPSSSWWQQTEDSAPTALDYQKVATVLNWFEENNPVNTQGGQCGHFVNQYLDKLGFGSQNIKDSIEDKASLINDNTPEIGSIVVMDSSVAPQYGHVAIIKDFDPTTGNMTVVDSNWKSDGTIREHVINVGLNKIRGYINPAKGLAYKNYNGAMPNSEFTGTSGTIHKLNQQGYIDALAPNYKYYNEKGEIAGTASESQALLKDYGITREQFVAQASNYSTYGPEAKAYLSTVQGFKNDVEELIDGLLNTDLSSWKLLWGEGRAWKEKFKYLTSNLTLQYFVQLKQEGATFGAMSDAEWDIIREGASDLGNYLDSITDYATFSGNRSAILTKLRNLQSKYETVIRKNPYYQYHQQNSGTSQTNTQTNTQTSSGTSQSGFGSDR